MAESGFPCAECTIRAADAGGRRVRPALQAWSKFLVPKGWIAIDGVSLTVVEVCAAAVVGVHCAGMSDVACPVHVVCGRCMLHIVVASVTLNAECCTSRAFRSLSLHVQVAWCRLHFYMLQYGSRVAYHCNRRLQ